MFSEDSCGGLGFAYGDDRRALGAVYYAFERAKALRVGVLLFKVKGLSN